MGHLVFSPDGRWMLADTYPVDGIQTRRESSANAALGYFRHEQPLNCPADVRCDLHPRWSADGRLITVDSIHSGRRAIYQLGSRAETDDLPYPRP